MTEAPADYLPASSPSNYEQPLPAVPRTNYITQVPPTKKITFFKSGDPQFGGVKMAINQRSFKSFNALMDDLSHRVPLPFGVRTITTPRGIHCISALDQLEDGGCYLCSDKKYVKPFSISTGRRVGSQWNGHPASALRRGGQEGRREDHFSQQGPKIPKKVTLIKNGDIGIRRVIILNHRNARSFKTLLDEISELLQFTVRKLYTVDGKKIDSMQALLHCPSVLVCGGREPFKPLVMENSRKHSVEKLPSLASQSSGNNINENNGSKKDVNFGLKAKKSVIHPRSPSSNRSMRFSLSSEKSYANGLNTSLENGAPFPNHCPHGKSGDLFHSLVSDDIEKRVHVNKDGSLSVEMKVCFRLLNDETLQWSTQIKKSNVMSKTPCEESGAEEDNGVDPMQKMNTEVSSEADDSLYPCDADSYISKLDESEAEEINCHSCGKQHQDYDIWKNPLHASQKEEPAGRNTWHTRSSCSSTSSRRRVVRRKVASVDSVRTTSSEEYSEHIVQESSCYSETTENRVEYCNVKKCNHRSALSTAASSGEKQQECNRMNTGNSQTASSLGPVSHSSCENNQDTEETVGKAEASKTDSENEDENCMEVSSVKCSKEEMDEMEGSRVGSSISRSSQHSRKSKKSMCEEANSMARTMSACSLKKAEEDLAACSSSANSVYSRSSKCSVPRAKSDQDEHSDNDPGISSFSSDSCPAKSAEEKEAKQEDDKDNEVSSVSAKTVPSQSIKEEFSECERCSTQGSSHSKASDGNSRRSDSDEIFVCNASCSSRTSKRSKHSHIHLDAHSDLSVSSLRSTSKKKKKNSLHAEDSRSNSKASNYSKSSCEIKKKSIGDHTSRSDSLPSSTLSVSEAAAPPIKNEDQSTSSTSKRYSKSSKGTKQEIQPEESSKTSSPSSSFSNSNENNGEGNAKVSCDTRTSRHGSMSESLCSKCDHTTEAGNENPPSSRASSYSDMQGKCAETEVSRTSNEGCSQSSVTRSSKPRRKKMKNLHAEVENSSRASASEVAYMYSLHCPAPPKGKPGGKKIRTAAFKNSSSTSACTESVLTEDKEQKEIVDSSRPTSSGSKSAEMNTMKAAGNNSDDKQKEDGGSCKEKMEQKLQEATTLEDNSDLAPSALPNTSPEEVVQEWLSKIPPETLLMKYEMEDDEEEESAETTTEISNCANNQEISEEETAEKEEAGEGEIGAEEEMEKEAAETNEDNEGIEECSKEKKISEVTSERSEANQAECSQSGETPSQNNNKKDLPSTIQTSVQIMKALLNSKQEAKFDRSNSLPEVSPTMGRKLSYSANILITCLASLQLLDEEPLGPLDKSKCLNKPRYTELLNIFQALWFGCTVEKGGPSSGQPGSDQTKMSSGFKAHNSTHNDFTPMSSSGVDVSSGSGESGEGSVAGARDCTLLPQKTVKSKSAEQGASVENEPDLSETEIQGNEEEQCSRPSTSCSKFKREENAESTRADSPERGAEKDHHKDDQSSNCENGKESEIEENSKLDENEGQEEAEAEDEITPEVNTDEATEQPSHTAETDANADDANGEREAESNLEEQVGEGSPNDQDSNVKAIPETSVKTYPIAEQKSVDPNPVWVLRLLKKIEKEFMTHYVSAMNEFKIRWNLDNNELLDKMISELRDEVSKRIQKSIEKELRKLKSRAGQRTPRPPDETLRRESTIQTEKRRQRWQSMRHRSLFNDRNVTQSKQPGTTDLSFDVDEEDFGLSTALVDDISEQPSEEEYCPCDACIRKKMASKPIRNPAVAANAPIVKAFDLKQILKMKEENETENTMIDCASEAAEDGDAIPSERVEEAEEKTNPSGEDGEYEPDNPEKEPEADEEKETEQHETDEQGEEEANEDETAAPTEGGEISDNQNCEVVEGEEAKEEEIKEEEDEMKKEEEVKVEEGNEEEEVNVEEGNEEEEVKEEEGNEEEEVNVEEGNEEEEVKEEEGNEEEEVKEEEGNEEEEVNVEEGNEEEEVNVEEGNEDEEVKEEEGNEEEEVNVEEGNEEEEVKEEEGNEEEEVNVEEGNEEEEVKAEEGNEEEEVKAEEGNGEVGEEEREGEGEETQNEVQEWEEGPRAEEETEFGVEEVEGEVGGVQDEENAPECEEKVDVSDAAEDSEEVAPGGNEEADEEPQADAGDEAAEEASPEAECEACSEAPDTEEEKGCEGDTECAQENDNDVADAAGDEPEQDNEDDRDAGRSQVPEMASDVMGDQDSSKGAETLTKAATFSCNSSMGNCSQQSQKGSEDGSEGEPRDDGNMSDAPDKEAERDGSSKPAKMYPDSEEEDEVEDRASSCTSPVAGEKNAADDPDLQNNEDTNDGQGAKKKADNADQIDPDDLDF